MIQIQMIQIQMIQIQMIQIINSEAQSYVTKFSGITPESVHTLQQMSYNKLMADFLVCAAC